MPSARDCYYSQRLYPVTAESLALCQVTNDADVDEGMLIYDAFPVRPDDAVGSHAAWRAMNTNVAFDPVECRSIITPNAMKVQVRVGNSRI